MHKIQRREPSVITLQQGTDPWQSLETIFQYRILAQEKPISTTDYEWSTSILHHDGVNTESSSFITEYEFINWFRAFTKSFLTFSITSYTLFTFSSEDIMRVIILR